MSEQPHIAIHVFSSTVLISIDAVWDKLISKTLIKLRDGLQWEKVMWVIPWGSSEGGRILRKLHPSVSFLVVDDFHRNCFL